jgi:GT2 family glycosyltransferase
MDANLGIVVVNFNGFELTRACLNSIDVPAKLFLVDNNSSDRSRAELPKEFPDATLIQLKENTGFTGGYNRGMKVALEAGFDLILILNNDTAVRPGAIQKLVEAAKRGVVATPTIKNIHKTDELTTIAGEFDWERGKWGRMATEGRVEAAAGACLLFPRQVLERVGLFDEDFFLYYEDVDLCARLKREGIPIELVREAEILHHEGGSTGSQQASPLSLYYNHRNRLLLMKKHSSDQQWRSFVSRFTWTRIPILLRYAIAGDFNRYRAIRAGIRDFKKGRFGRADEWHG